jgi:dimethylargininase
MLTAITHTPSPFIQNCELTFLPSQTIDFEKAKNQHKAYCRMLAECGAEVINLDGNIEFPDCAFVEDTAIILDKTAVITPMGIPSRRKETRLIEQQLAMFFPVIKIDLPAQIEGGDVLRIGRGLYVGRSNRTDRRGIKILENIIKPFGYQVFGIKVRGSLHLKTACTALDDKTVLLNPEWVDPADFKNFKIIKVPYDEPFAANILKINDTICLHKGFSKTIEKIEKIGYKTKTTDISEFLKAEAGLTCLSLIFDSAY